VSGHPALENADFPPLGCDFAGASRERIWPRGALAIPVRSVQFGRPRQSQIRIEKPLKNRARLFVTLLVAATAAGGFVAWYKIDKDSLVDSFGTFRELFRYISFHAR
jgi:hypothetical protein